MEVRIGDGGEVQVRGDAVFDGYLDDESSTSKALAGGWLLTGDLGELDDDGYLRVTGRNDDLVVTSAGRRIAPNPIEQKLETSQYIRTAVVVGAGRPRPGALLVVEASTVGDWAASHDVGFTTFKSLTEQPQVRDLIATAVDEVNLTLDEQDRLACFALLPENLTHDDGALTATYKLRRRPTEERLASVIDAMYADQTKRDAEGAT
jgi:long-chain acyl-CoA synthetase